MPLGGHGGKAYFRSLVAPQHPRGTGTERGTESLRAPLLFLCRLLVRIDVGRALRPLQRERLSPPSPRCDCGKGRLRESCQQLSTPAPTCGQWPSFVPRRAGAQAETLGVTPSVPEREPFAPAHKEDRQFQERLNQRSLKGLMPRRLNAAEAQGLA